VVMSSERCELGRRRRDATGVLSELYLHWSLEEYSRSLVGPAH